MTKKSHTESVITGGGGSLLCAMESLCKESASESVVLIIARLKISIAYHKPESALCAMLYADDDEREARRRVLCVYALQLSRA